MRLVNARPAHDADVSAAPAAQNPRTGRVHLQSWAGHSSHPVIILAETPKRFRVQYIEPARLPTRFRPRGAIQLVPKHAVSFDVGSANHA
jgi:hypothetical protein